jgi:arylsulfatase
MTAKSLWLGLTLCLMGTAVGVAAERPPNIVVLFADDLGYSDVGCYGGEIDTPALDRLAAEGLRFTQFYNTARCWPSRAALLTGYYAQQVRRDALPGMAGGGQGKRPAWAPLLPKLLEPAGYRSYHSGKWHVDGDRLAAGFHKSYSLEDHNRLFSPQQHLEDDRPAPPITKDAGHYVTVGITDHALRCLDEHARDYADRPFFSYVAYTAPHFPLHAPAEVIARYLDRYQPGWGVLRAARHARQQTLGLNVGPLSAVELDVGPPYHNPQAFEILGPGELNRPLPWDQLTPEQRTFQATKMAIHAAMVDVMDQQIARLLARLDALGAAENTIVMFLSDNGASAEIMVRGDGHNPQAPPGSAETYLCLGPGWSTVANTPFRRHKTWVHEGGIATPFIVRWPRGITDRGGLRASPAHVIDLVPTLLELAGVTPPDLQGPGRPGVSLVPEFQRSGTLPSRGLWWLHEGNAAYRDGDWKLVKTKAGAWELYDLAADRAEQHDLSTEQPERVKTLAAAWDANTKRFTEDAQRPASTPKP